MPSLASFVRLASGSSGSHNLESSGSTVLATVEELDCDKPLEFFQERAHSRGKRFVWHRPSQEKPGSFGVHSESRVVSVVVAATRGVNRRSRIRTPKAPAAVRPVGASCPLGEIRRRYSRESSFALRATPSRFVYGGLLSPRTQGPRGQLSCRCPAQRYHLPWWRHLRIGTIGSHRCLEWQKCQLSD